MRETEEKGTKSSPDEETRVLVIFFKDKGKHLTFLDMRRFNMKVTMWIVHVLLLALNISII